MHMWYMGIFYSYAGEYNPNLNVNSMLKVKETQDNIPKIFN